ncbi:peptidase U62, modulator of DNA gyrase [Candidatus Koribacter versatilis Ellin345]|uniref:Peptidase U62, modulator of DNA gyrase n=1 Tax=Koribacter versatilis (strain Ellin345) TaxID=204669 RepID=Q1IK34_KORVE|nr:TldD/PmbA family protein [Candidatus Koribacter versatilis]ABF42766.1 peptidase U62, modulator of DNA gyrase [Candidatus Koribacter versatilis Ellin345]
MLTREQAHDIFGVLRKSTSCDEVELLVSGGNFALTRFANNGVTQNVSEENYSFSVRVNLDGRTARATTNKRDAESLKRVVEQAEALARVQQQDPDLLPMPTPREVASHSEGLPDAPPSRYFEATAAMTAGDRAQQVERMVTAGRKHGLTAAGTYSSGAHMEGVFNSRGVTQWHEQSSAEASITMLGENSSGWQKANSTNADDFDAAKLAEIAAEKASLSADPKELPAGKYTVVLEPSAVLDIVGFMFWDFSGLALLDQRSFLNDRVGKQIFGDELNISDDVYHPLQSGFAFDGEGMRRSRVNLVEGGVPKRVTFARATAALMAKSELGRKVGSVQATGHGFALPNEMGEAPMNIVFAPPKDPKTVDQMVNNVEHGILVTRLWYIREVEPYEKILTGMTRDGTFLIENGKVKHGVRNFRFNQGLIAMLSNIEAMSMPVRASGEESIDMVVPAMTVREFNFTEVTKF